MTDKRCENCKFSDHVYDCVFDCRKNPPVVRVIGDDYRGTWPSIYGNDWCGEFSPKSSSDDTDTKRTEVI